MRKLAKKVKGPLQNNKQIDEEEEDEWNRMNEPQFGDIRESDEEDIKEVTISEYDEDERNEEV